MSIHDAFVKKGLEVIDSFYSLLGIDKEIITNYRNTILKCSESNSPTDCLLNYINEEFNKLVNDTKLHELAKTLRLVVLFDYAQLSFPLLLEKELAKNSDKCIRVKDLKNYELVIYGITFIRKYLFQLSALPTSSTVDSLTLLILIHSIVTALLPTVKAQADSNDIVINNLGIFKILKHLLVVIDELIHSFYSTTISLIDNTVKSNTSTQVI